MIVATTLAELRSALAPRRDAPIAVVPTMGALHEGHLSLVTAARARAATVVLTIFVNPTQFTEQADLDAYPRALDDDLAKAGAAGVDVVFAPTAAEMYPTGFATTVSIAGSLTETFEGAVRGRAHFDGVATIVSKLLLAALADTAYFGQKDAQQVAVVRRLVRDLGIPTEIVVVPTSRDDDGLARSSRNVRLTPADRVRALALPRALAAAARAAADGEQDAAALRAIAAHELDAAGLTPDYLAVVDSDGFAELDRLDRDAVLVVAARVGAVRLLDNVVLAPVTASSDILDDRPVAAPTGSPR